VWVCKSPQWIARALGNASHRESRCRISHLKRGCDGATFTRSQQLQHELHRPFGAKSDAPPQMRHARGEWCYHPNRDWPEGRKAGASASTHRRGCGTHPGAQRLRLAAAECATLGAVASWIADARAPSLPQRVRCLPRDVPVVFAHDRRGGRDRAPRCVGRTTKPLDCDTGDTAGWAASDAGVGGAAHTCSSNAPPGLASCAD